MEYEAFLTGSRVYGRPTPASDIDLVVFMKYDTAGRLFALSEGGQSIRFGRLNILAISNEEKFCIWRRVTNELEGRKPVTRGQAVAAFKAAGITDADYTSFEVHGQGK